MVENIIVSVSTKRTPQVLAALAATVGCLGTGMVFGWSAPALPSIQNTRAFALTEKNEAWLGSLVTLGAMLTCPVTGYLAQKFGRKFTMLIFSIPFFIGWLLIGFADSLLEMKIGRFLTGFAGASYLITSPMYIAEITDSSIRGFFGVTISLQIAIGVLFTYVVGTYINWSWLSLICSIIPLLVVVTMIFMPESPRYLLETGKVSEASQNLCWLRGAGLTINVDTELRQIQRNIAVSRASSGTWRDIFKPETLKPTFICVFLIVIQQASGINVITFYSVSLIRDAGTNINENLGSIILAIAQVLVLIFSSAVMDRFGRRILFMVSAAIMGFGMLLAGIFFIFKGYGMSDSTGWLLILGLTLYIMAFALGVGPIPWLLLGELLPPKTKGYTSAIAGMTGWLTCFILIETYGPVKHVVGDIWSYWLFAVVCAIGFIFVYFMLPETKGRSLDEIQTEFQPKTTVASARRA